MPQYEYQGINAAGRSAKGAVIADNLSAAKAALRKDGIFPSQLVESAVQEARGGTGLGRFGFFSGVSTEELSMATRQLATLIAAHVPLVESLSALTDQVENPRLKATIAQIKADVNEGMAFNKALGRYPKIFSDLYVSMVAAGEASGAMDIVLLRLSDFLEYQDRLKTKVKGALTYPILMLAVALIALLVIFTQVIPEIESIFSENEQTLPTITQVMLNLSRFILGYWWAVLIFVFIAVEVMRRFLKSKYGSRKWDDLKLKLPLFGGLIRMVAISRFTKTLSTLLRSGIPLLTGLKVVKAVVGNQTILRAIEQASSELTEGQSITDPLKRSGQFPPLVTHMISVGEQTGDLENMLERVSDHYEYQVDSKIQNFTALLEPIMIILLSGIVMVIILSVILPMLNLNEAVL